MPSAQFITANLYRLHGTIPAPGQSWRFKDVRDAGMDKSLLHKLDSEGAIEQEEKDKWGAVWKTNDSFAEAVKRASERQGRDPDAALLVLVEVEATA